jgi:hypothetical protein
MKSTTLNTTTFTLKTTTGGAAVTGTVTYNPANFTARFAPIRALTGNTSYTATVTTGATDLAGTALAADFTWSYTTATPTYRAFTTPSTVAGSLAGTLVLVHPSPPNATTPFAALVSPVDVTQQHERNERRVRNLASGTWNTATANKQVQDLHRHAVLFANGGRVFALSAVVSGTPTPVQISSISDITNGLGDGSLNAAAGDLCDIFPVADFSNVNSSIVAVIQAGPDKLCRGGTTDDVIRFFPFSASSTTAPTPFPAGFSTNSIFFLTNLSTGAFDGLLAARSSDGMYVKLSGPTLATQTLVTDSPTGVTESEPISVLSDGRMVMRTNNTIRVYDPAANSISAALFTFNQATNFGNWQGDGTNLFFTDNPLPNHLTNVIQRLSFAASLPTLTADFFTGAAGTIVSLNAVTPGPSGRLIFQENGAAIKSIPKGGGSATTLVPSAGQVDFIGVAIGTPVKVYANVNSGAPTAVPGSGTWTAQVVNEDGTGAASHPGDSRWVAGSFGTTVNVAGYSRFLRQVLLLTRAAAITDDGGATVASFNALVHGQIATLGTLPANLAFFGDPLNNFRTRFFSREEGGAKLLIQGTYRTGTAPDVFFADPLVANSLLNVGGAMTDIPLDFKDVLQR